MLFGANIRRCIHARHLALALQSQWSWSSLFDYGWIVSGLNYCFPTIIKQLLKSESSLLTSLPRLWKPQGSGRQAISCYGIFSLIEIYGTLITVQVTVNAAECYATITLNSPRNYLRVSSKKLHSQYFICYPLCSQWSLIRSFFSPGHWVFPVLPCNFFPYLGQKMCSMAP